MTGLALDFKCGKGSDSGEWQAILEPIGPKLGFVRFERHGESFTTEAVDSRLALRQQLDELLSARLPLPPPPQAEIVRHAQRRALTSDEITNFGVCLSCLWKFEFLYARGGGRSTGHRPAWYLKSNGQER